MLPFYNHFRFIVHVIYLHGFCSSSQSFKAQLVQQYVDSQSEHSVYSIDLPFAPADAMSLIETHISTLKDINWAVVGSSLGGYYATYLSEKYQVNAVLINPAVKAYTLLEHVLGENTNYHSGEVFNFTREHLSQLERFFISTITRPEKLLLLTQTADEVLDYVQGVEYYNKAKQTIVEGGSHGFDDYEDYLEQTFTHLAG
ncbi:MAG: esterase [Cycloclasticus sp.]|nr:MAG: esterase [Cycloclasticus sp.]